MCTLRVHERVQERVQERVHEGMHECVHERVRRTQAPLPGLLSIRHWYFVEPFAGWQNWRPEVQEKWFLASGSSFLNSKFVFSFYLYISSYCM